MNDQPLKLNLPELFDKHQDEHLKFDRVPDKMSSRPDLHAFMLLDKLFPGREKEMVAGARHDEICLEPDPGELACTATEEQIVELIRCGVMMNDCGLLTMHVF